VLTSGFPKVRWDDKPTSGLRLLSKPYPKEELAALLNAALRHLTLRRRVTSGFSGRWAQARRIARRSKADDEDFSLSTMIRWSGGRSAASYAIAAMNWYSSKTGGRGWRCSAATGPALVITDMIVPRKEGAE
jgi:hypothetical protein